MGEAERTLHNERAVRGDIENIRVAAIDAVHLPQMIYLKKREGIINKSLN